MAIRCEICGKSPKSGNSIARRGLAKRKGGVGKKTTGITPRRFKPNIQKVRVKVQGKIKRVKLCTSCLKSLGKPHILSKLESILKS